MILDARTIALLFVDGLSVLAIALLAWIAVRGKIGREKLAQLEDLDHLLALAMGLLLLLRVIAWAGFFLVLDGYVPGLAENGVMCAFGVVQLRPELAHFALWAKPVAVGCLLSWWALSAAERDSSHAPFQRLRFALVLPMALILGLEVWGEARWLFADKLEGVVTCCRSALDPSRSADWFRSTSVCGLTAASLLTLLFASKISLTAACAFIARRKMDPRLGWTVSLCAASTAIALLDLDAWREAVAPRALGLEFHRCAYEIVTRSFALGPAALLAAIAHLGLFALPLFALLQARDPEGVRRAGSWILGAAALGFATELVVLAVHVF